MEKLQQHFGVPLPQALLALWKRTASINLEPVGARLLSPEESYDLVTNPMYDEDFRRGLHRYGFLPLLDMNSSDYVVACVREPLAPRYAWLPHDDGPSLLYRDLDSYMADLLVLLTERQQPDDEDDEGEDSFYDADSFFHHKRGDYLPDDGPRSRADQEAALSLLQTDGKRHQWNFATQLLDDENTVAWEKLLETDHFIRRDVTARLKNIPSPTLQAVLSQSNQAMDVFAAAIGEAAIATGMKVGVRTGDSLKIGKSGILLECFFHRRHIPDAIPRLIAWLQDQDDGKDPNLRANNYMVD